MVLVDAGVDTFVSLIGEYDHTRYLAREYPSSLSTAERGSGGKPLQFIHFPIRDFEVVAAEALIPLVAELKKRMFGGSTIFMHCRGGHGRTGMVVIALISAVFDMPVGEAMHLVSDSTGRNRPSDQRWGAEMPETQAQAHAAQAVQQSVTKHKR